MIIWGVGLFVHYKIDPKSPFGEEWTESSRLQLVGFVILITGQAIYGEIVRLPGLRLAREHVKRVIMTRAQR